MSSNIFNFEEEFKLGINQVDEEHIRLVNILNLVHSLLKQEKRAEARQVFKETLSAYVGEHFDNEEKFMESFNYPDLEQHKKIHENFKNTFLEMQPAIESDDDTFRKALSDTFTWILTHIGKTDKRYAKYYFENKT